MKRRKIEPIYRGIGATLKAHRLQDRMTQQDLAKKCGISRSHISNVEKGKERISVHALLKMIKVLKIKPSNWDVFPPC